MTTPTPVRVLIQHALTGEWLHTALPVTDLEYGPELSGPGSLTGTLAPHLVASNASIEIASAIVKPPVSVPRTPDRCAPQPRALPMSSARTRR